jgi:hypothetical protein
LQFQALSPVTKANRIYPKFSENKKMKRFIFILAIVCLPTLAAPQMPGALSSAPSALRSTLTELGLPFIRNYSPKEYGAQSQNWVIVQDSRGVMYFGNYLCVLEYDGVSFVALQLPNKAVVHCSGTGPRARI